ncbi:hypothetical protein AVEN_184785-1 [Araneus ventricosus]|uniref:SOCS box domain-containing protein n=1 Tax=Araneus ventricosus TaxID=182803 RepID=A0A4Y2TAK6_ARAVE|nr:hypothetical protein AVEN_184785-1 [Araneus ventricosus]
MFGIMFCRFDRARFPIGQLRSCIWLSHKGSHVQQSWNHETKQLQVPFRCCWISNGVHLLLQVLRVFDRNRRVDKECLYHLEGLPDSFFTSDQLMFTHEKIPHPMRVSLQAYKDIARRSIISDSKPRSLQHHIVGSNQENIMP